MHTMGPPSHSAGDQGVVEEIGDHKQVDRTPAGFVSFSDKEEAEAAARGGNLAVWVCGIDKLRVLPYPLAQMLGANDARIQIKSVGICGSDIHYVKTLRNSRVALKEPMVLGHESAGIVVEVGESVTHLAVGDRVALEAGISCGRCSLCKTGSYNLCRSVRFFGSPPVNGALAEQVVHPAELCFKLPDNVSLEEGAMCEPLSVGVHACRRASVGPDSHVLILGAGPIGLITMLVARAFGASHVVLTDVDQLRLDKAKELGAAGTVLVSTKEQDIGKEVAAIEETMGADIDVTFDCAGFTKTMTTALEATRSGGKVCLVGMGHKEMTLPLTNAAAREVDIMGVFRYRNTYPLCIDLISSGRVDVRPLITHRFGLSQSEVEQAFKTSALGGNAFKVMFSL